MKNKKEKTYAIILILGTIVSIILFMLFYYLLVFSENHLILKIFILCTYIILGLWANYKIDKSSNKLLKITVYILTFPLAIIYLTVEFINPFMTMMINLIIYLVICLLPMMIFAILMKLDLIHLSHEIIIFITLTIITIVAVTFNKYIVQLILKHSPAFKHKDDIETKEMSDLTKYLFSPNNIRFIIYLAYFIFIFFYSLAYIDSSSLNKKLLDNSILQAFLVFLAYDSIRINSKDIKILPSYVLHKVMNVFYSSFNKNDEDFKVENDKEQKNNTSA